MPMSAVATAPSPAAPDAPVRRRLRVPHTALAVVGVVALTALAAVLRLRALGAPYWIDEGISVGISSHPLGAIPEVLRQDGSPPLYYLLLHVWISLFGTGASATHSLSAGIAIACVPAAWWALSPFGFWPGLVAAGLMAVDPYVGLYADETRMYSLELLLALLVCGAFLRAFVLRRRIHAVTFAVVVALALYTHAWGAFLAAAAGVAWLAMVIAGPDRRGVARDGVLAFAGAALLFAPWVPTLLDQAAHTGAPWSHRPTATSLDRAISRIWSGQRAEKLLFPLAGVGAAVAVWRGGPQVRRGLLAMAIVTVGTLLSAWAYSRFGSPAWALRYLVVVLAPMALLVAFGLGRLPVLGPLAVVAAALLAWHGRPLPSTLEHKSNVAQVVRELRPSLPHGTLVFSTQPEQVPELAHELGPGMRFSTPLGRVTDPGVMNWRDALTRLRAARFGPSLGADVRHLRRGQRLLLVQPLFSHPDSPWTRLIRRIAHRWGRDLRHDPLVRHLRTIRPTHGSSRSSVDAILMVRR
ncbi:MAG: mannosyltransferase [Solirubrobacteraceae bacterium]|nr:mannosyltransferase [Solirubrobacteraceae bacterium]MEA2359225.1 mannosyltransferase [Solirubrobacteraceae bacterium]MEA2395145.1 mannosyltransferase [Solirubrobacteraceae bacterium]